MGTNSNAARAAQLGMPFGTAAHRLRKLIMFDMMKRLDEDSCFKCGTRIQSAEELSIEHKLPWLGRDTGLFWDLNNIAFSHLACNRPESHPGNPGRRTPEQTSHCSVCGQRKHISEFHRHAARHNGVQHACRDCRNSSRRLAKPSSSNSKTGAL